MTKALADYIYAATGKSNRALASEMGLVHTTLAAQLSAEETPPSVVARICRRYDLPLATAFVVAGYLTEEEARTFSGPLTLSAVSDLELSKEMLRRVAAGTASPLITEPVGEEILNDVLREVEDARLANKRSDFDLAAEGRRDRTPGEFDDDEDGQNL